MPLKLLILGAVVVGVTIGVVVANNTGSSGVGGCQSTESATGTRQDSSDAATGSSADSPTNPVSSGGDDSAAGGSGDGGTSGDGGATGGGSNSGDGGSGGGDPGNAGGDGSSGGGDAGGGDGGSGSGDGDSGSGDGGSGSSASALTGQFRGSLTLTSVQIVSEPPGLTQTSSLNESITFDATGRPEGITILNYAGNPNLRTTKRQVGEEETLTTTFQGAQVTLIVRVTEAFFTRTTMRLRYAITFNSQGGNLRQTGSGTQVVTASLNAEGALSYAVDTDYAVRLIAGSIRFDTTESKDATGVLPRQTTDAGGGGGAAGS